jgi:hypothetical protein
VDIDTVADELYAFKPEQFTAERNARAVTARKAGERALAKEIGALRRPTAGAWLVNVVVRERAGEVGQLLELGTKMRRAQEHFAGDALRSLSQERTALIRHLEDEARIVAEESGQRVTEEMLRDLRTTLEAALADAALADALRKGRLTSALSYSGFGLLGQAPAADLTTTAPPAPGEPIEQRSTEAPAPDEARQAAIAEAETEVTRARRDAEVRDNQRQAAAASANDLEVRLAQLEDELAGLRAEAAHAADELREATHAQDGAHALLREAESRLARALQDAPD